MRFEINLLPVFRPSPKGFGGQVVKNFAAASKREKMKAPIW
jgi:hypothetical protein